MPGAAPRDADAQGTQDRSFEKAVLACLAAQGRRCAPGDLLVGLPLGDRATLDPRLLPRALANIGFEMTLHRKVVVADLRPPCLLRLRDGDHIFVAEQQDGGDTFIVLDPDTDRQVAVPRTLLAAENGGEMICLSDSIAALAARHAGPRPKGHWFWGHFAPLRARVFDVMLASAFANILAVVVSLFALQVYDRVIPNQNEATLWVLASGAAVAIFMEFLLRLSRARLIDKVGRDIEVAANRDLFERLINVRLDQRQMPPGSMVNTMREFASVKEFFAVAAVGVLTDLPFVLIFLAVIYAIGGPIVIVVALGGLAMIVLSLVFQRRIHALSRDMLGGTTTALRLLTEASYGLETLRSHNAAPWFQRNWEEVITLNARQSSEHRKLSASLSFAAAALQMLTYIAAVTAGVYLFFGGLLSVGGIIAVSILTSRTLAPIVQLSSVISRWQNTTASLEALKLIATAPQQRPPDRSFIRRPAIQGKIRLLDIRTAYPGVEQPQLVIPRLDLEPGSRWAVLGENGSGKSLFLRILAGLYEPTIGSYMIDGIELRQIDPDDLRRAIAYLPQDSRLFKGTLRENLLVGSTVFPDARLFKALEFAGLDKLVSATTRGLDLEIQDGGEGLSVGQRAAVGLARVHLHNPALVLLDEPTAAMDSRAEALFVKRFSSWLDGRGAVVCTHRLALMEAVDNVMILSGGRMIGQGPKAEMLSKFTMTGGGEDPARLLAERGR
jgi:ATP-binding cassette, subfamily C, bacterial LapB